MALLADRVKETTTTTGTGTVSLAGAPAGFQSFNTAFANGSLVYYVIQGGAEWEIGIGTTGTGTLARTTVLQSSNADALVPFSAGVKDVFCSYVADRAVTTVDAATLTNKTLDDYTNNVGANSTHFRIKATGTLSKGTVVKATGYNPGENAIEVAVVTSATDLVLGISEQALTNGQFGLAVVIGELFDVNTNGFTVGNIIYSNGAGGFTQTKPASGLYQALGWIVRANTNNGVIAVNVVAPLYVETATNTANTSVLRDGSGNFAAGTITATAVNATTLDLTNLEVTNIKAKDGTQAIAIADTTGKLTISDGVLLSALTASQAVFTDGSKNLVSNAITGTGNVVMSASPTLTGTVTAATLNATTLGGTLSTAAQPNVTSVGTLGSLTVAAKVSANSAGTAVSGFSDYLNGGAWDILGASTAGSASTLAIGGYRSSQWIGIDFYTGGVSRALIDNSGNLAVDTNTLFVDAANNRVGVGTTGPSYEMDIRVAASNALRVGSNGNSFGSLLSWDNPTGQARLWSLGAYSLILGTNGTSRAELDSSGNLGLGVTPSAWYAGAKAFQFGGNAALLNNGSNSTNFVHNGYYDTAWRYIVASQQASYYAQINGQHQFFNAPSGANAGDPITFVQAMTLDASGRLLLGRTSGTYGVDLTSPDGNLFRFTRSTDELGSFISSNVAFFGSLTSTPLAFMINSTERARITSGGNFYVGTASAITVAGADGVHGFTTATTSQWITAFQSTGATPLGVAVRYGSDPNNTSSEFLYCVGNTTVRASIRSNGGLANYQSNNVDLSDARTKKDITPAASMWSKIGALEIVTYKYTDQTHDDVNVGVIAQQVEAVEPVWVDADGFGETPADGVPLKTVYTKDITFAAIKALQEAMARIETLEQRVLALEA